MIQKNDITLQEATEQYLKSLEQSSKSPRTLYTYGKGTPEIVVG